MPYDRNPQRPSPAPAGPLHSAMEVPADYVEAAERVWTKTGLGVYKPETQTYQFRITNTKLRSFLSLANDIYNLESLRKEPTLAPQSMQKLNAMRIRILYDAGRDPASVKPFVEKSRLIEYIKGIGNSREKFMNFARYLEALVAYHRFLGGQ